MTTTNDDTTENTTLDEIVAAGLSAAERLRQQIADIKRARDEQPARLARARAEADEARGWAILEEPWDNQWSAVPGYNGNGDVTAMLALPNITAKEVFGARLACDILDCGNDDDRINTVLSRYFTMVHGEPGMAFLLFASALTTVASLVVPQLLEDIEQHGSNWDARVMLAEARVKAWNERVSELRGPHDRDGGE